MIRALLRTINDIWKAQWSVSAWGLATRAIDRIVDRTSPPLERPPARPPSDDVPPPTAL